MLLNFHLYGPAMWSSLIIKTDQLVIKQRLLLELLLDYYIQNKIISKRFFLGWSISIWFVVSTDVLNLMGPAMYLFQDRTSFSMSVGKSGCEFDSFKSSRLAYVSHGLVKMD